MQQAGNPTPVIRPRIEPQFVRIVGDSVGVVNLSPGGLQLMADQLTLILQKTLEKARNYSIHSRRTRMTTEDLETALRDLRIQPPLPCQSARRTRQMRQLTMPSGEEIYVREDGEVDVGVVTEFEYPLIPIRSSIKAHWLAVDGKIANVPENVAQPKEEEDEESLPIVEPPVGSAKAAAIIARRETMGNALGASVSFRHAVRGLSVKEQFAIKPPIVESLSVEQQLFMKEIVEACVGTEDGRRLDALQALELDTGLQVLLPRLSRMIHYSIRYNIVHRCLTMLIYVVRIIRSISLNKSVKLDGVLHELIPSLLSCMVSRQLCVRPETDNHWALRDFAVKTFISLIKDHNIGDTRERAVRTLRRIFDDSSSTYPMIYGSLSALTEFSAVNERYEIHFRILDLMEQTHPDRQTMMPPMEKLEAQKLNTLLTKVDASFRKSKHNAAANYISMNTTPLAINTISYSS